MSALRTSTPFRPPLFLTFVLFSLGVGIRAFAVEPASGVERFYIGTYSGVINVSSLDLATGTFGPVSRAVSVSDPSFLTMSPDRNFLYAVSEGGGAVVSFSVNPTNGALKTLNQRSSNGGAPAHIALDRTGKVAIVANYNGGSITAFPIQADGKLGVATAHIQHPGSAPHPHCVTIDASNKFVFICDKGLDQIRSYVLDATAGTLTTNTALITKVAAGSGPRHMVFDLQYKRAYVICELSSKILGFDYDAANGILTQFQTISTLPAAGSAGNTTAEIAIHPSGQFLYGSNRGYNSVVVYTINPMDGTLTLVQQQLTGRTPRNFAIDPTGAYCIVAGQDSSDIRLYTIDPQTGLLTDTGKKISTGSPVCILPFILTPPQPVLSYRVTTSGTIELTVGNTLKLLTYQLYRTPALSSDAAWDLLMTGTPGQTNFALTHSLPQEFFQVGVLPNY